MSKHLINALEEIENEKGIGREVMREAIEAALVSAYRKHYGADYEVEAHLDLRHGRIKMFAHKTVVEEVLDPLDEIALADARGVDPAAELAGKVKVEVSIDDFGRIAAQTAMQVVMQRMREAERNLLYEEYFAKKGEMVNGVVQRRAGDNIFVNIGKLEALLPKREQSQGEQYAVGDRIKVYIAEVKQSQRGPRILVSRSNTTLVRKLFELEIPEVFDKIVEIKAMAREPGQRTKIAVMSNAPTVDPLGACVGARSARIQAIVRELGGEKIDIVIWDNDPARFIMNALSPAKIKRVLLEEEPERVARVLVADDQLSLSIGKRGQNARLAARLTGWKIDIIKDSEFQAKVETQARIEAQKLFAPSEVTEGELRDITHLKGVGPKMAENLRAGGFGSIERLRQATLEEICAVPGIGVKTAEKIMAALAALKD